MRLASLIHAISPSAPACGVIGVRVQGFELANFTVSCGGMPVHIDIDQILIDINILIEMLSPNLNLYV